MEFVKYVLKYLGVESGPLKYPVVISHGDKAICG